MCVDCFASGTHLRGFGGQARAAHEPRHIVRGCERLVFMQMGEPGVSRSLMVRNLSQYARCGPAALMCVFTS